MIFSYGNDNNMTNIKNKKMTSQTIKINSKLLAIPIIAVLLTLTVVSFTPTVSAVNPCLDSGVHCYSTAKRTTDNRGGSATININSGNSVQSGYAIANPVWIGFSEGTWLEGGWQKGNILPCSSTTAKYYTYEKVSGGSGVCVGATSGSTMTAQITDSDRNNVWQININGALQQSIYKASDAVRMTIGGESTHPSNVLNNGKDNNLAIISTGGVSSSWGSTIVPTYSQNQANYYYSWTTQYTNFNYGGP